MLDTQSSFPCISQVSTPGIYPEHQQPAFNVRRHILLLRPVLVIRPKFRSVPAICSKHQQLALLKWLAKQVITSLSVEEAVWGQTPYCVGHQWNQLQDAC